MLCCWPGRKNKEQEQGSVKTLKESESEYWLANSKNLCGEVEEMATRRLDRRPTNFGLEGVDKLYHHFIRIDKDGNGHIDKEEFLKVPSVAENPLAQRLLEVMDVDQGGTIDFKEFVRCMSIFSKNTSRQKKLKFAFDIYDLDRDGFISNGELYTILRIMSGDHLKPNELQNVVDRTIRDADKDGDGKISFEEFQGLIQAKNSEFLNHWDFEDL